MVLYSVMLMCWRMLRYGFEVLEVLFVILTVQQVWLVSQVNGYLCLLCVFCQSFTFTLGGPNLRRRMADVIALLQNRYGSQPLTISVGVPINGGTRKDSKITDFFKPQQVVPVADSESIDQVVGV